MKKVLIVVTDQFEDLEAIGVFALLKRAKLDVTFAAINATKAIGRYGLVSSDMVNLNNLDPFTFDCLVIPGGPEYIAEENNKSFLDMVSKFVKLDKVVAAICAGPTILGHLGLLRNKKYTCFTSMNEDFGGEYIDKYVVSDGNIITGRSAAAVIDFSFEIIEKLTTPAYALEVKKSIYY